MKPDIEELIKNNANIERRYDHLSFVNFIVRLSTIYLVSYLTLPYPIIISLIFFSAELNRSGYFLLLLYIFKFMAVDSLIPANDVYIIFMFFLLYNELGRKDFRFTIVLTPLMLFMVLEGWPHKLMHLIF